MELSVQVQPKTHVAPTSGMTACAVVPDQRTAHQIVFNQDMSHFAVLWQEGGFTKFDTSTLQLVYRHQNSEKLNALALQHRTTAFICSLHRRPNVLVDASGASKKFFSEKIHRLIITEGAHFTLIQLES